MLQHISAVAARFHWRQNSPYSYQFVQRNALDVLADIVMHITFAEIIQRFGKKLRRLRICGAENVVFSFKKLAVFPLSAFYDYLFCGGFFPEKVNTPVLGMLQAGMQLIFIENTGREILRRGIDLVKSCFQFIVHNNPCSDMDRRNSFV